MDTKPFQLSLPLKSKTKTSYLRAGEIRCKSGVKEAVGAAISNCSLSREEIATELSRLTGDQISIHTINNWTSDIKSDRYFPLEYARALTLITGDINILKSALEPDFMVITKSAKDVYDYGLMVLEDRIRGQKRKQLEEKGKHIIERGKVNHE